MTNEELKQAAEVMLAAANGKRIQYKEKTEDEWVDFEIGHKLAWDWFHFAYRIKPSKTFRPWKSEEVPLGAQTRVETYPSERDMIVGVNARGVLLAPINTEVYPFEDLLELRQHSTDGGVTWKHCGVEVES